MDVLTLVGGLRGSQDWRRESERVAEVLAEQPWDALALAAALEDDLALSGFDLALDSMRRSLVGLLVRLEHDDATAIAVRLASESGTRRAGIAVCQAEQGREAMQIAGTRPAAEIWDILADPEGIRVSDPEFGLLLTHELVVRGEPASPVVESFLEWALETSHPLAWLPSELLAVECGLPPLLPRYGSRAGSLSVSLPDVASQDRVPLGDLIGGLGDVVTVDRTRIGATFREWTEQSNGRIVIAGYRPRADFPPGLLEPRLHRDCRASLTAPSEAVEMLFSTVVASGAYSQGPGGAYSRLRAWEAVSGIVDREWPCAVEELARAASIARWIRVEPDDPWFNRVAWDAWQVVDLADRVVVLAATDTD